MTSRLRSLALAATLACAGTMLTQAASAQQPQAPAPQAHTQKVGVINVRRAVLETEEGLRVEATLRKLFDSRNAELEQKQQKLQEEKEKLEKDAKSPKANKEQLQKRWEELQRAAGELQVLGMEYQREFQRKEQELRSPVYNKVLGLVQRLANQDAYEVIIDAQSAPFFRKDLDLTDKIIQMYNAGQVGDPLPTAPPPKALPNVPDPIDPKKPGKGPAKAPPPAAPKTPTPAPAPKK